MSYCDDCIHKPVCYRTDSVSPSYADKCGDFMHDNNIKSFKPMVEIDLYSVIKQRHIERDVLDKNGAITLHDVFEIIDKYKAESEG